MTDSKPSWVPEHILQGGPRYREYPPLSIASWHEQHGLLGAGPKRKKTGRKLVGKRGGGVKAAIGK
jgi:hypothetical protein